MSSHHFRPPQEEFVKRMAQAAQREAGNDRRSMVSYRDIGNTIVQSMQYLIDHDISPACSTQQYQEFMFLKGMDNLEPK